MKERGADRLKKVSTSTAQNVVAQRQRRATTRPPSPAELGTLQRSPWAPIGRKAAPAAGYADLIFRQVPTTQASMSASQSDDSSHLHNLARQGTRGSVSPLPHLEAIQRSFGPYDVSAVEAHTDAKAIASSRKMGAAGYTSANHVAFASADPNLFTAAHEAAHVIQQRAGIQLSDSIGRAGDHHEKHADAVAANVVAGQSSAELLREYASAATIPATMTIQRQAAALDPAAKPIAGVTEEIGPDVSALKSNKDAAAYLLRAYDQGFVAEGFLGAQTKKVYQALAKGELSSIPGTVDPLAVKETGKAAPER